MIRITPREIFKVGDRQLEVYFYTSNIAKFLQARLVFERAGLTLRHFRTQREPYAENYEWGKEALLRNAIAEVGKKGVSEHLFFVEDTSLRIDALSASEDFPGLAVKEWFSTTSFKELDQALQSKDSGREATVKSDIALNLPGDPDPIFFHGETSGTVAPTPSEQSRLPRYPWLGPETFNGWFIPNGAVRRLGDMDFETSQQFDFRVKALIPLIDRLEEYAAILNLSSVGYRKRSRPREAVQPSLFSAPRLRSQVFVVVGRTCAGKTTLAERAVMEHGFRHIEASSVVRMFQRKNLDPTGKAALSAARDLLEEQGADFVARQILRLYGAELDEGAVITGLRTMEELVVICDAIREAVVLVVEASERTRFERHLDRERYVDAPSLEMFRQLDEGQVSLGLLRISQDIADLVLDNEDSLDDYLSGVDQLFAGVPPSAVDGLRRLPNFGYRTSKSQVFRSLLPLIGEVSLTSRQISDRTAEGGERIATRNVNKVLRRVPELARRITSIGEEIRYQIAPAGIAYVRFMQSRPQEERTDVLSDGMG